MLIGLTLTVNDLPNVLATSDLACKSRKVRDSLPIYDGVIQSFLLGSYNLQPSVMDVEISIGFRETANTKFPDDGAVSFVWFGALLVYYCRYTLYSIRYQVRVPGSVVAFSFVGSCRCGTEQHLWALLLSVSLCALESGTQDSNYSSLNKKFNFNKYQVRKFVQIMLLTILVSTKLFLLLFMVPQPTFNMATNKLLFFI